MSEANSGPVRPLWQKGTSAADWVTRFTVGEDYRWDQLLLPHDIRATLAHAWGLETIAILTGDELREVELALKDLESEFDAGRITVRPEDEDCHTVIEHYLTNRLGETGKKIHTGRSRNDQVLAALRLYLREALRTIASGVEEIARALCTWGNLHDRMLMPGYTHMQRAMPSTVGLWAMGFAELVVSDLEAIAAATDQINVSPLGSAAGYGVPYLDLPREAVAKRLGFRKIQTHVTAVQLSRGKLELHVAHALAQVAATLNRLAADLVLFNTSEFAFVKLPAEYCTGSSIMPQKKNPDVLELARASYHRIIAEMHVLLTLPANLPSGYHRDLQLTKEAVMRTALSAADLVEAMKNILAGVTFNEERLRQATTSELLATARALELVQQGLPFREAYRSAARDIESIGDPESEEVLSTYRVSGFPGLSDPEVVLRQLEELSDRLDGRG
jgi:argininosuccinate lyase